ncbi:MAG TPA: MoaD/ThiS family protein [Thermoleophilaceae bacterium]|jgi:molybdopterin converting factor small subunit|nr:MoaD/ThiS family protein [Thermoleophilaceae bacterium]
MTAENETAVVRLRGQLKKLADDRSEHAVRGATVADALRALEASQPALAGWILDERGRIRRHINVFVNAEQAREDDAVAAGDELDVLPAISGGDARP